MEHILIGRVGKTITGQVGTDIQAVVGKALTGRVRRGYRIDAPTALPATAAGEESFIAHWTEISEATGYCIDVATDAEFTEFVSGFDNLDAGLILEVEVTGLSQGTTYYYRVRAYCPDGISEDSNSISQATTGGLPDIPEAPVATAATDVTGVSFAANWGAVSGATSYKLDVAKDSGFTDILAGYNDCEPGDVVTYPITGLEYARTYYYRVRAKNEGGTSGNSNIISQITLPQVPAAPAKKDATDILDVSFSANWYASTGATGYKLTVATDINFSDIVSGYNDLDVGDVVTYPVTGLTYGKSYYYRLKAYNTGGTSANGDIMTLITAYKIPIKSIGSEIQSFVLRTSADAVMTIDNGYFYDSDGTSNPTQTKTITGGAADRTFYLKYGSAGATANIYIQNGYALLTKIIWIEVATGTKGVVPFGWTYAPPPNLTYLYYSGADFGWTYTGALPTGITVLYMAGGAAWTYTGALPTGLTNLTLSGSSLNWTGLDVSGTGTMTTFYVFNFKTTLMTGAELITLLTSMAGRAGVLPATCTLGDYANSGNNATDPSPKMSVITAASPNVSGNNAEQIKYWIGQVLAHANVTKVTIMSTDYND